MIGDWVIRKGIPQEKMRVMSVDSIKKLVHMDFTGLDICESVENLSPITLTDDIIGRNGFKTGRAQLPCYAADEIWWFEYWDEQVRVEIEYDETDLGDEFWHVRAACGTLLIDDYCIEYVHELQHVFNLIGYNKDIVL